MMMIQALLATGTMLEGAVLEMALTLGCWTTLAITDLVAPVVHNASDPNEVAFNALECSVPLVDAPVRDASLINNTDAPASTNTEQSAFTANGSSATTLEEDVAESTTIEVRDESTNQDATVDANSQGVDEPKRTRGLLQELMEWTMDWKQTWYMPEADIIGPLLVGVNGTPVYIEEPMFPDIKKAYETDRVATFYPSGALSVVYRKERTLRMSPLGSLVIVAANIPFIEEESTNTVMESQAALIQNPSLLPQELTWGEDDDFLNESLDFEDVLPARAAGNMQHAPLRTPTTMEETFPSITSQDDSSSFNAELFFRTLLAEAEMPAGAAITALVDAVCDPTDVSSDSLTPSLLSTPPIFTAWNDTAADDSSNSSSNDLPSLSPPPVFSSFFDTECDEEDVEDDDSDGYFYDNTLSWSLPSREETELGDNLADLSCVLSLSPPPKFEEIMSENAMDDDEGSPMDASGSCDLDSETAALDQHHSFKSSQGLPMEIKRGMRGVSHEMEGGALNFISSSAARVSLAVSLENVDELQHLEVEPGEAEPEDSLAYPFIACMSLTHPS
ncbi:hypothetical protein FRB96_009410 [Tulasnella sp. 330]|nr:hypothetical protein FRB96_009410 [Tulasnella sp. 330]